MHWDDFYYYFEVKFFRISWIVSIFNSRDVNHCTNWLIALGLTIVSVICSNCLVLWVQCGDTCGLGTVVLPCWGIDLCLLMPWWCSGQLDSCWKKSNGNNSLTPGKVFEEGRSPWLNPDSYFPILAKQHSAQIAPILHRFQKLLRKSVYLTVYYTKANWKEKGL